MNYTETPTHVLFLRGPFSNFAKASFTYLGQEFETTEQAFMYAKAVAFNDQKSISALLVDGITPQQAKGIGRGVQGYVDSVWTKIRYQRMLEVNREKFKIPYYRELLLATGNKEIIECNPRDTVWSCGLSENDPDSLNQGLWLGSNLLGKVLMQIRDEINNLP